jgi:hypothetical protein
MFKPFSLTFFVAFFVWLASILFTTAPATRLDRACIPVEWSGAGIASAGKVFSPDIGLKLTYYGDQVTWGCKYWLWDLFYRDDWMRETGQVDAAPSASVPSQGVQSGATPPLPPALQQPPSR